MVTTNCIPSWSDPKQTEKNSAHLAADMALHGTHSQAHQPVHSFQDCLVTFLVDAQVAPGTA